MNDVSRVKPRPLSPRLSIYRWQSTMIASVVHRASGLVLVLFVPLYLWLLHGMTGSPEDFVQVQSWLHSGLGKLSLWVAGVALFFHYCNGLRFLSIDAGWFEQRRMLRLSARIILGMTIFVAVILGMLL